MVEVEKFFQNWKEVETLLTLCAPVDLALVAFVEETAPDSAMTDLIKKDKAFLDIGIDKSLTEQNK